MTRSCRQFVPLIQIVLPFLTTVALSGDSLKMLTSLNYLLKEEQEHCYESRKEPARKARDKRFCKISLDLFIQDAVEDEDDTFGEDEEY